MLDFMTTLVGVSFTVLSLAVAVAAASLIVCIVTLIKNLPRGIRALREATESSVYAIALYGQSVAEEEWFARLQAIFGKYVLFGVCGIYVTVAKFFADGAERALYAQKRAVNLRSARTPYARRVSARGSFSAAPASYLKLSVVMKQ